MNKLNSWLALGQIIACMGMYNYLQGADQEKLIRIETQMRCQEFVPVKYKEHTFFVKAEEKVFAQRHFDRLGEPSGDRSCVACCGALLGAYAAFVMNFVILGSSKKQD